MVIFLICRLYKKTANIKHNSIYEKFFFFFRRFKGIKDLEKLLNIHDEAKQHWNVGVKERDVNGMIKHDKNDFNKEHTTRTQFFDSKESII